MTATQAPFPSEFASQSIDIIITLLRHIVLIILTDAEIAGKCAKPHGDGETTRPGLGNAEMNTD